MNCISWSWTMTTIRILHRAIYYCVYILQTLNKAWQSTRKTHSLYLCLRGKLTIPSTAQSITSCRHISKVFCMHKNFRQWIVAMWIKYTCMQCLMLHTIVFLRHGRCIHKISYMIYECQVSTLCILLCIIITFHVCGCYNTEY